MKVGWILTGQREIGCRPERFDVGREGLGGEACAKNISAGESDTLFARSRQQIV
jgi:hypothetical protein